MDMTKSTNSNDVKCFNIIGNERDRRFGLECGRLLLKKNSEGKVAAQIKCSRCGALYDIKNGNVILINRRK